MTSRLRCLIVDDNADFGEAAADLLEAQGISVVDIATSGGDALAKAETLRPQLALVDLKLGDESGFEIARQLVARGEGTKVILISSEDGQEFVSLIEASPALGFLPKTELSAAAIHRLLAAR